MENQEETLKRIEGQTDKIKEIATLYHIDNSKVKELFLNCPQIIDRSVAFYLEYKIGKELFDKHWLYDCIRTFDDFCSFGGYRTFENLVLAVNKIEESIGKVVKVYNKKYVDGSMVALLVQNQNKKFLVTLGSDTVSKKQRVDLIDNKTPEQKLLQAIFGNELKKEPYQEHFWHHEYVCELNIEKNVNLDDVIQLLAALSSHNARRIVNLNPKSNVYYLADSEDIITLSLENISELDNEEKDLHICFYGVEPLEKGKINVKNFCNSTIEEGFDLFEDLE